MTAITNFDTEILFWISSHLKNVVFDTILPILTRLGDHGMIWIILTVILICFKRTRAAGIAMGIGLLLSHLLGNMMIKPLVERLRPFEVNDVAILIPHPGGFSFPSGHTFSSFAAAVALYCFSKKAGIPALVFAAIMGFSRMYLFVHYPTDVMAGMVFGILTGIFSAFLVKRFMNRGKLYIKKLR